MSLVRNACAHTRAPHLGLPERITMLLMLAVWRRVTFSFTRKQPPWQAAVLRGCHPQTRLSTGGPSNPPFGPLLSELEQFLHGRLHDGRDVGGGLEALNDVALAVDEELGEVPLDVRLLLPFRVGLA